MFVSKKIRPPRSADRDEREKSEMKLHTAYRCETDAAVTLRPSVFHSLDAPRQPAVIILHADHETLTFPVW